MTRREQEWVAFVQPRVGSKWRSRTSDATMHVLAYADGYIMAHPRKGIRPILVSLSDWHRLYILSPEEDTRPKRPVISVQHECADGWHHFTSEEVPGFYLIAAQDDLDTVVNDIPAMLEHLIGADERDNG